MKRKVNAGNAVAFEGIDELDFNKSTMQGNYPHVRVSDQAFFNQEVSLNGANAVLFEIQAMRRYYSGMGQHCKVVRIASLSQTFSRSALSLVAALLGSAALALHDQFPINTAGETGARPLDVINSNPDHLNSVSSNEQWSFDECTPENATGNLIFNTVHSLLQHWPNTRYRNGHNIVLGVIPIGTLLYHGTNGSQMIPSRPEWAAMDPEHSIYFSRGNRSGWHLTLATTRPLKVLYFDGSSAAKLSDGTMDTQDIIAWGEPRPERFLDERDRIEDISGVEVVSFLHLTLPWDDRSFPPPTSLDHYTWIHTFEVMHSGLWHNRYPGDSRIVLDLTGLISLYDTVLVPSLISVRAGLERLDHRVLGISSQDLSQVMRRVTEIASRPDPVGSGTDWKTLIHVIVDRYEDRLELTQYLLNVTSSDPQELFERAKLAQTQLRVMLTPYLLHSTAVPSAGTLGI
ncbi:hypothetical protein DFJ58DRAFT_722882 [Suillus subalutaceus]|uniref:uncharacterized protein n=1 Tax=Suillus subalutaceus TaxID=48586 RepID=UPI001B8753AE|nr:uncharacterized protein DFJ58DRAFT_722882 [Suillus subalutaceus]KAG1870660.1 hypothetical protein DFJ58DRAFT_722882 [Suillus subalutaceus]